MKDCRTQKDLKDIPVLENGQLYIYVMLNDIGKIKIGQTTNIAQRYQSLCGSNSQGNEIIQVYCSPATYLYVLERMMHEKFEEYRIKNTEWFEGQALEFNEVTNALADLFRSKDYWRCNKIRKKFLENKDG